MELHNEISSKNLIQARNELDKHLKYQEVENQYRVHTDEGMKLKIIEDNYLDKIINTIDKRRIVLEKKANIIHDYYGDELRGKDIVKDYYSYKKINSAAANLVSGGILLANLYNKVTRGSYFVGGLGTVAGILLVQSLSRYCSNNKLESQIDRPWKIHNYRMSQGLGPTNYSGNQHTEKIIIPDQQAGFVGNVFDFISFPKFTGVNDSQNVKSPPSKYENNYDYDKDDRYASGIRIPIITERQKKFTVDDENANPITVEEAYEILSADGEIRERKKPQISDQKNIRKELSKRAWLNVGPDRNIKLEPFMINNVNDLKGDRIVIPNRYLKNPYFPQTESNIPNWNRLFNIHANRTPEFFDKIYSHWKFRNLFDEFAKEHAKKNLEEGTSYVFSFNRDAYYDFLKEYELQERLKEINVNSREIKENTDDYYDFGTEAEKYSRYHYNSFVKKLRPKMLPEKSNEFEYDFDFDVDETNYDPWVEYQLIHKDVLVKGRKHFIMKQFPDWVFLRIGKPESIKNTNRRKFNNRLPNTEDSIFNMIHTERYFDQREKKEHLYNGRSMNTRS